MNYNKSVAKVLSILFLFIVSSCNIEPFEGDIPEDISSTGNNVSGTLKVDFDSQTYVADITSATVSSSVINITGLKGENQELITLTVFANSPGTYEIGVAVGIESNGAAYNTNSKDGSGDTWIGVTNFIESQGEVTITEIDNDNKTISGTFSFTGHNTEFGAKEFTNGIFEKISFASNVVPGSSENSFFAKVDGVEFKEEKVNAISVSAGGLSNLGISATINSTMVLGLNLDPNITPGEYALSTFGIPSGLYSKSFSESFSSETGKVIITQHDIANKRISGTFEFTATSFLAPNETHEITEGSFDVTYF